mmetsp:Transcript_32974/g.79755  ORF Transcript_32974/g.79755 Transcript_32974/m.79755 type:complete len:86 (+) Transcript_32974:70-327(+)
MNSPTHLCTIVESPRCFEDGKAQFDRPGIRNTADTMKHIKNALANIRDTADGPDEMSVDDLDCMLEQALSLLASTMEIISTEDDG